jgi:NADH-quinone oxidoreductase subunit L
MLFTWDGSLDYRRCSPSRPHVFAVGSVAITFATLALFLGATGKSAQIPLYTWLPDAMEGPTPVSALIHAATMVTAGVYMVARCHVLYQLAPISLETVGGDRRRHRAVRGHDRHRPERHQARARYSTVSQLGYMFFALRRRRIHAPASSIS